MTRTPTPADNQAPWYRHRWPWILISVPAASVVLGIILITTALNNPAILVVDNYYSEGRAINQSLELDHRAQTLGLKADITLANANGAGTGNEIPQAHISNADEAALRLFVYHATDEERDRVFLLLPDAGLTSFSPESETAARELQSIMTSQNTWYFELRGETDDWRLRQRVSTPATEVSF